MEQSNKTKELVLIALFSAINIGSRWLLTYLPNIKPTTALIMLCTIHFGIYFALKVTIISTVISGIIFGITPVIFFQILSWFVICIITHLLPGFLKKNLWFMAIISFIMGYVFGLVVSLEKLLYVMDIKVCIAYWIGGLSFDTLHAVGNFIFYLILAPVMGNLFKKISTISIDK